MILIVGGGGYIGSHVNKGLMRKGYETVILDNLVYGHRELLGTGPFIYGDMADMEILRSVFKQYSIEAVMHFAAYAYVNESVIDPEKYYTNNVSNTLNLLRVMREFAVDKFIFSSTCATYGIPREIPLKEDHAQNPINPYGRSKLMVEMILKDFDRAFNFRHVSLRYFNAAGADPEGELGEWHEPETHLIPLVLDVALGVRDRVEIYGDDYDTPDGTCIRDYIHVTDLADAHILSLKYLIDSGESQVFNLGNGDGFSVKEVVEAAREVTGKKIEAVIAGRREGDPATLIGSADRAVEILKWKPRYNDLRAIIETAWQWHQKLYRDYKGIQKNP